MLRLYFILEVHGESLENEEPSEWLSLFHIILKIDAQDKKGG